MAVRTSGNASKQMQQRVMLAVRMQPSNADMSLWDIGPDYLRDRRSGEAWRFDHVFGGGATNSQVFRSCVQKVLEAFTDGLNATLFAYGQSGSGKSFTMQGDGRVPGLVQTAAKELFHHIGGKPETEFLIAMSYFEIHHERVFDLLANGVELRTEDRDHGLELPNLVKRRVRNGPEDILQGVSDGNRHRHKEALGVPSCSHVVFQLHLESASTRSSDSVKISMLRFVELAASEGRRGETTEANRSSHAVSDGIKHLAKRTNCSRSTWAVHKSTLTRVLPQALGGNSLTAFICTCSPEMSKHAETLNTMKTATQARRIENTPVLQVYGPDRSTICHLRNEISSLRTHLTRQRQSVIDGSGSRRADVERLQQVVEDKIKSLEATIWTSERLRRLSNSKGRGGQRSKVTTSCAAEVSQRPPMPTYSIVPFEPAVSNLLQSQARSARAKRGGEGKDELDAKPHKAAKTVASTSVGEALRGSMHIKRSEMMKDGVSSKNKIKMTNSNKQERTGPRCSSPSKKGNIRQTLVDATASRPGSQFHNKQASVSQQSIDEQFIDEMRQTPMACIGAETPSAYEVHLDKHNAPVGAETFLQELAEGRRCVQKEDAGHCAAVLRRLVEGLRKGSEDEDTVASDVSAADLRNIAEQAEALVTLVQDREAKASSNCNEVNETAVPEACAVPSPSFSDHMPESTVDQTEQMVDDKQSAQTDFAVPAATPLEDCIDVAVHCENEKELSLKAAILHQEQQLNALRKEFIEQRSFTQSRAQVSEPESAQTHNQSARSVENSSVAEDAGHAADTSNQRGPIGVVPVPAAPSASDSNLHAFPVKPEVTPRKDVNRNSDRSCIEKMIEERKASAVQSSTPMEKIASPMQRPTPRRSQEQPAPKVLKAGQGSGAAVPDIDAMESSIMQQMEQLRKMRVQKTATPQQGVSSTGAGRGAGARAGAGPRPAGRPRGNQGCQQQ